MELVLTAEDREILSEILEGVFANYRRRSRIQTTTSLRGCCAAMKRGSSPCWTACG
jgi:hypothetical protein